LQPSGLFAAAIFVALNVVLIYPVLIEINQPLALAMRDAGGPVQVFVGVLVVLIVSYVRSSLTGTILNLMSGELWQDSEWISKFQKDEFGRQRERGANRNNPGP
jgi:hypothetical protein